MAGTRNLQLGSVPEGSSLVPGTVMISKSVFVVWGSRLSVVFEKGVQVLTLLLFLSKKLVD